MRVRCNDCGNERVITTSGMNQRGVTRETYLCRCCASKKRCGPRKKDDRHLRKIEWFASLRKHLKRKVKENDG